MRILKTLGLAAALAVAACSQPNAALKPVKTTEAQLDKLAQTLVAESYRGKDKIGADMASVSAALPPAVKVTWASLDFEAASGATILKTVKITPADNTEVGVSIDTLKLWDFDATLAKARLGGQRLTETAPLASRIDASGISAFGLGTLMKPAMDAYTDAVVDAANQIVPNDPTFADQVRVDTTKYDFRLGRLILDDVVLRPYELTPAKLPADHDMAEAMPALQGYTAIMRSFGVNAAVFLDMTGDVAFRQAGEESTMKMGIGKIAYRGWRGWDADMGVITDMSYDMTIALPRPPEVVVLDANGKPTAPPSTTPPPAPPPMAMSQSVERVVVSGTRLDKAAGFLARGKMPPRTESDLLSLGVMRFDNMKVAMAGAPLYSMGRVDIDMSHWRWFIPNAGKMAMSDLVYDVNGLIKFVQSVGGVSDPATAAAMTPPPGMMETLAKYGLDKPSFDGALTWNWNPDTGATTFDLDGGLDAWTRLDTTTSITMPTFKAMSDLIPETGKADDKAMEQLLRTVFRFISFEMTLADEGGFEKGFAAASELAKYLPDDQPEMQTFKNLSAAQLRGMASSGAYFGADTLGQQFPPARDILRPYAEWVTKGGKVRFLMKPKTPLSIGDFEANANAPDKLVQQLGITVTHTPPPGSSEPKS